MIILFFICSVGLLFCTTMAEQQGKDEQDSASATIDTVDFKTQIQPILQKRCTPCHFPGGKMYERMPFDKGETIIGHEAGIVKRLKDEQELALIKQFIRQNSQQIVPH